MNIVRQIFAPLFLSLLSVLVFAQTPSAEVPPPPPAPPPALQNKEDIVVLLLHGLNSTPEDAWGPLNKELFAGNCAEYHVKYPPTKQPTPSPYITEVNLYCYMLRFGFYDFGRAGLAGDICDGTPYGCKGDYSTFEELGNEVKNAVEYIVDKHKRVAPDGRSGWPKIILLGHSRGGLAARAYLQQRGVLHKASGLITTGTPHLGSPLGRSYAYSRDKCTTSKGERIKSDDCNRDWSVVDFVRKGSGVLGTTLRLIGKVPGLRLQAPGIDYLSPSSSEMAALKADTPYLPALKYVSLVYDGMDLGVLARIETEYLDPDIIWSVFTDGLVRLSAPA
jgi:pimeloyl-ACP methyl ester carboxylesterase